MTDVTSELKKLVTRYDLIPFSVLGLYFIPLFYKISNSPDWYILVSSFVVTIAYLTVAWWFMWKKNKKYPRLYDQPNREHITKPSANVVESKTKPENENAKMGDIPLHEFKEHVKKIVTDPHRQWIGPFTIFSAVFGIIAALSITDILTALMTSSTSNISVFFSNIHSLDDLSLFLQNEQIVLTISFFPIGILFYHCGIVFLTTEARERIEEHKIIGFFSSLIIFVEGIILLFVAHSSLYASQFALWMFILMALDVFWVSINITAKGTPTFQWLHLDSAMLLFTLTIISLPITSIDTGCIPIGNTDCSKVPLDNHVDLVYWFILAVFTLRTIYDYNAGWKFWTKFIPKDSG